METKKFIQFGTLPVVVSLVLFVLFIILIFTIGLNDTPSLVICSVLSLIMLCLLFFFYQMVIEVDQTFISFSMGVGLFHKQYRIDNLCDCKPVFNPLIYGVGIRHIPNGMLYNISGNHAVELTFKDSEKVIRLGTNKPEEIVKLINGFLGKELEAFDDTRSKKRSSRSRNQYLLIGSVLVVIVLFNLYGLRPANINVNDDCFIIGGLYGLSINYKDIDQFDTLTGMPGIKMKTDGFAVGKVCKGNFWLNEGGSARLFVNCGSSPFIKVRLNDGKVYYINFKERQKTIDLYDKITEKLK